MSNKVNLNADWDGVFNFDASKSQYNKHMRKMNLFGHLKHSSVGMYKFLYSNEAMFKFSALPVNWVWTSTWNQYKDDFKFAVHKPGSTFLEYLTPLPSYNVSLPDDVAKVQYETDWMLTKGAALKAQALNDGLPFVFMDDCAHRLPEDFFAEVAVPYLVVVPDPHWGAQDAELRTVTEFVLDHS